MKLHELVLNIVAPESCLVCGLEGSAMCETCASDSILPLPERCFMCLKQSSDYLTCSTCRRKTPLVNVWVASEYENIIRLAIRALKFERKRGLARPLARIVSDTLPYFAEPLVVPVPTATARVRQRGFDHARLLAEELARHKEWRCLEALRRNNQVRQVGSNRQSRQQQIKGAFRAIRHDLIKGREILLVDDVVTTGSTLNEAAKTLKAAGAKRIHGIAIAHRS